MATSEVMRPIRTAAVVVVTCLGLTATACGAPDKDVAGTTSVGATTTVTVTQPAKTVTVTATPTRTAASTPTPASPVGLTVAGSGVTATAGDGGSARINVLAVRRENSGFGREGEAPKNGTYVVADIRYEGVTGTFTYNPYDWTVRDSDGRAYQLGEGNFSGIDDPSLDSGTVSAGSNVRGALIVDAPAGALELEYAPGNSEPAVWEVPVTAAPVEP